MARTKKATSGEGGSHLTIHRYDDGTVDMKWNWDALLRDVQIATGDRTVQYVDAGDISPEDAAKLLKTVEAKVKKTRKKKQMAMSRSPDRGTFQKESYLKSCENNGKEPDQKVLDWHQERINNDILRDEDPEWQKDNLEYDLRTCDWILEKVRASKSYAQNLYAAMCNREFQKLAVAPILKEERWSCSWRHAGGIVADMRQEGDYIDWYCSGIRDELEFEGANNANISYVPEGEVTEEIQEDLQKLGWAVLPE